MSQLGEAIARYHKILESEPHKDLAWANALQERMVAKHLVLNGKPACPVLRPHFITRRQYNNLVKAAEPLATAVDRVEQMALGNPALLARMELLPAEKMLATVNPGYSILSVTSLIDTHLHNGTLRFARFNPETPGTAVQGDDLADLFFEAPPMKEFRKRYSLEKLAGRRCLLQSILKAYKEFGGKGKRPRIAILEITPPFQNQGEESVLLMEYFREEGLEAEVVSPDQLEYRNGVLRRGTFAIDLVLRRVKVHEFLVRFDLSHPLLRAYRDGKVCVVNNFRSELTQKNALFDLLTDENITGNFPAAEKKAIRDFVPWTRVVASAKTRYQDEEVDLPQFILKNRQRLVLRPNDDSTDQHAFHGADTDDSRWEKALKTAMHGSYVVQEVVEPVYDTFPLLQYGHLEMRKMRVDLRPHMYLGKVQGCSSWLTASTPSGFTTLSGVAPTFILESR